MDFLLNFNQSSLAVIVVLNVSLFLGFLVTPSYEEALKKIDSQLLKLFINSEKGYLNEVLFEGNKYLGKFPGEVNSLPELLLLEKNIYSILKKIAPDYPYEDSPLLLFAVSSSLSP